MRRLSHQPTLPDPSGYPNAEWNEQRVKYSKYWLHFDGDWLDERIADTDELRYPLQLNPFNLACMMHASFLFGEVRDGNDPLVTTVIEAWGNDERANSDLTAKLSDLVNRVWHESRGRSIQTENGIISQVLGGCVFGVGYDPRRQARNMLPVRVERVMPEHFYPVYSPSDYWDLLEAFVAFQINRRQAREYGVSSDSEYPLYQEMWARDRYEITVDGEVVTWLGFPARGRPIGGFVPFVYIPHIRTGDFWGVSLLDRKLGIAKEINDRYADIGDVMAENARQLPAMTNVRKVGIRRLDNGTTFIDLGNQAPGIDSPNIIWPPGSKSDNAAVQWAKMLVEYARVSVYTPPVVYGLETGNQRSQLSLAISMIPLIAHIRQERSFWTDGLNEIARQILLILSEKTDLVSADDISKVKIRQEWAPVLPRDQERLANEMILRVNAGLIAPETAMAKLGDIRDLKTEMNLIKTWLEWKARTEGKQQSNPFAGAGMDGTQAGQSRPKVQANISKE